jgi:hypothetical protein
MLLSHGGCGCLVSDSAGHWPQAAGCTLVLHPTTCISASDYCMLAAYLVLPPLLLAGGCGVLVQLALIFHCHLPCVARMLLVQCFWCVMHRSKSPSVALLYAEFDVLRYASSCTSPRCTTHNAYMLCMAAAAVVVLCMHMDILMCFA